MPFFHRTGKLGKNKLLINIMIVLTEINNHCESLIYCLHSKTNIIFTSVYIFLQLAVQVIHNMHTVKQLTIEKGILKQYSNLFQQSLT